MDFNTVFDKVLRHLDRHGVACEVATGKRVTKSALGKAEGKMKLRLPAELREFYETVANGFTLCWQADPDDLEKPFASLQIPALSYLADMYIGWRRMALYSPKKAEEYGFPYTKDPALSKRTAARMWHWLPVLEEGNGDMICLDLSDPNCPVIFNQHDWLDGGTGDNGHVLAPNWREFLTAWGSVAFSFRRASGGRLVFVLVREWRGAARSSAARTVSRPWRLLENAPSHARARSEGRTACTPASTVEAR